jgi:hypothetical protein
MNSNSGISSAGAAAALKIAKARGHIVATLNIEKIATSKKKYFDIIKKLCYNIYTRYTIVRIAATRRANALKSGI